MPHVPIRPLLLILVSAFAAASCQVGSRVADVPPATSPHGTSAELRLRSEGRPTITGELITVHDTHLLLETNEGLTLVPYSAFDRARFPETRGIGRWNNSQRQKEQLAGYSRYPFGVDDELLQRLLSAAGQDELVVITPESR